MSDSPQDGRADEPPRDATPEQLEADIEATRERLAATVEELAAKADLPAQAKAKAHEASERVADSTRTALARARRLPPALWAGVVAGGTAVVLLVRRSRRRRKRSLSA